MGAAVADVGECVQFRVFLREEPAGTLAGKHLTLKTVNDEKETETPDS